MNCCGEKRQSLNFVPAISQAKQEGEKYYEKSLNNNSLTGAADFWYTGNTSLEIKSLNGNTRYLFSVAQRQLSAMPEDVAMMRGYAELIEKK